MGRKRQSYKSVDCSTFFPGDPISELLRQDSLVRTAVCAAGFDPLYPESTDSSLIGEKTGLKPDQVEDSLGVLAVSQAEIAEFIARCS